jgi:hypothetical protein
MDGMGDKVVGGTMETMVLQLQCLRSSVEIEVD